MNCKDLDELLSAYSDRELDLLKSLEIEDHLRDCVTCSDKLKTLDVLRNSTSTSSLYYSAPAGLRERIQSSIRKEDAQIVRPRNYSRWMSYAACIAVAFLVGLFTSRYNGSRSSDDLTEEIVSNHLRSLVPDHLTDVASTDQHTVKPWFNGKVDFSPVVKDFSNQGFPLIGGRLDYIQLRRIPVLIYAHRKHYINVYSWATTDKDSDPQYKTLQGYHVASWIRSGAAFHAVSDLNLAELQDFVKLMRSQP